MKRASDAPDSDRLPSAAPDGAASDRPGGRGPSTDATAPPAVLRPMTTEDIAAGLRLCRASGWNQLSRDWEHFLEVNPGGARVLERQQQVVGTVATLRYGPVGWLAMVLVDPSQRRRGLGTQLLTAGLDLLAELKSVALDATPAGEGMYRTRGFTELERLSRMTGVILGDGLPPRSPIVRPMQPADLPLVAHWDAEAFGLDRRRLLEWLYAGAPEYAWVALQSDRVTGYTLGRHGFDSEHLGPILARSLGVAIELASACLATHAGRSFVIDARRGAPAWIAWLEAVGFREQRPFIRMGRDARLHGL
jgi:ribosomal protein S18 acetylase RimI-like enzyme